MEFGLDPVHVDVVDVDLLSLWELNNDLHLFLSEVTGTNVV
jgi:hypothetical protein